MTITIQESEERIVAVLSGELDTVAATEAETTMQPLLHTDKTDIVLDCTDLTYIASSGLRLFLSLLKSANAHGAKLTVKNINSDIQSVFKATGFSSIFHIE